MHKIPAKTIFAAMALLASVQAHTRFTTLFVDGKNQGDGVCVRMDMNGETCNSPIAGIQSPEMACGRNGETGVARVCPAKGGSTLTFEFREWVDGSRPGAIDPRHEGPCAVYMKKVDSAVASKNAAGDGWFKIWDEGFDEAAGKWCINKMIDNNGHLSVTVPSDIEGGYYLVRPELLALQAAQDSPPNPQFYVGCAQLYLDSTGSAKPATVTIPENYVDISMPGMTFNIYSKPLALPYPLFGPSAYNGGSSPAPSATATKSPLSSVSAVASPSVSATVKADDSTPAADESTSDANPNYTRSADTQAANGQANDSGVDDTEVDDTEVDDTEVDDTEVDDTEVDDTEVDDTEVDDTEVDDNEAAEIGADDSEADDEEEGNEEECGMNEVDGSETDDSGNDATNSTALATHASSSGSSPTPIATKNAGSSSSYRRRSVQTEGLKPDGCVMVNANWCGFEVKSYSNENGCWSSSADCWTQSKACFDQAPPTGAKNCDLWNDKCNHLDDTCNAKQFTGPPDAGKDLTPTPPDLAATASRKLMALVKKHESHVMRRVYRARH